VTWFEVAFFKCLIVMLTMMTTAIALNISTNNTENNVLYVSVTVGLSNTNWETNTMEANRFHLNHKFIKLADNKQTAYIIESPLAS
jgi:hypothetical protein